MVLAESVKALVVSDAQRRVDQRMVPYDLWATKAHVLMLARQNIVSTAAARSILKALVDIQLVYEA